MAESELGRDLFCIEVTVSNENPFFVFFIQVVVAGISSECMRRALLKLFRQCYRKFSRRIYVTEDNPGQGVTTLHAGIPCLDDAFHFADPLCHIRRTTADQYDDGVG